MATSYSPLNACGYSNEDSSGITRIDDRASLVAAARGGSVHARNELIELVAAELWQELYARRMRRGNSPSNGSSDHVQETMLRLELHFDGLTAFTYAEFLHLARKIRCNLALEYRRNRRTRQNERHLHFLRGLMWSRTDQESEIDQRDSFERIVRYGKRLRRHEWDIVRCHACDGQSYGEIAEAIGSTPEAVRKVYERAVARLRSMAEPDDAR